MFVNTMQVCKRFIGGGGIDVGGRGGGNAAFFFLSLLFSHDYLHIVTQRDGTVPTNLKLCDLFSYAFALS